MAVPSLSTAAEIYVASWAIFLGLVPVLHKGFGYSLGPSTVGALVASWAFMYLVLKDETTF